MGDAIAAGNLIVYILFGVSFLIGSLIMLYFNSVMKQKDEKIANLGKNLEDFKKTIEKNLERFKETSRSDDKEVKKDVMGEIFDRRNDVIKLHERVKVVESANCDVSVKVAYLDGLHEVHKKVG